MEKIKMNVTTEELTSILMEKEKGTFTFLVTETKVRMNKTGNPFHDLVTKVSKLSVLLGNDYGKRVIKKTGDIDFVPQECKVGEHISKCVLHNDNTEKDYLQYEFFEKSSNCVPPTYTFNGNSIEKQLFESYLVKVSPNKHGLIFPSVTISNIKECHMDGYEYKVVNP